MWHCVTMRHRQKCALFAFAILGFGLCHTVSAQECKDSSDEPQRDLENRNDTQRFLTCAGLGSETTSAFSSKDVQKLRGLLTAGFDFYNFFKSSRRPGPVEDLIHAIRTNLSAVGGLSDAQFIRAWFHVSLKPQLTFQAKDLLSCLSMASLSCESYQALVMELEQYKREMPTARQMMVYKHLMQPFLSRNSSAGCVRNSNSSGDWLMKNFQSFASFAKLRDILKLNMNFSALDVLDKLTPEHKAELILYSDTFGLNNNTIIKVLQHLIQPLLENKHLNQSMHNMTMPSNQSMSSTQIDPKLKAFLSFLRPLGNFIHKFVSAVREKNESSIQSHSLAQVVVNWTLSELAGHFSHNFTLNNQTFTATAPTPSMFNVTNFEDWFQHVVVPILKRFLSSNNTEIPKDLTDVFNHVFTSNGTMDTSEGSNSPEICRFSNSTCSVPQITENFAVVLRCVTNTTMNVTGQRIKSLVADLVWTLRGHMMNASSSNITHLSGGLPALTLSSEQVRDPDVMGLWAATQLAPALPLTTEYATCLSGRHFSCNAFQALVQVLGQHVMNEHHKKRVYVDFIVPFLSRKDTNDPGCVRSVNDSRQWIKKNFGPFSAFSMLRNFSHLNGNFSAMDALCVLTTAQLGELAQIPGQLRDPQNVKKILSHVEPDHLGNFFDILSPAISGLNLTQDVKTALLQQVFDRANLSHPSRNDTEVLVWLKDRLKPLLQNMTVDQVQPYFSIIRLRDCNTVQQGVDVLNSIRPTLMNDTQEKIQMHIKQTLREPTPLRCYKNNSFLAFLNDTFRGFEHPKLTDVLSLIPPERKPELLNSVPPSELGAFLRRPNVVDNTTELCSLFNSYNRTPEFLENEELPEAVRPHVLPCVWPQALAAEDEKETDRWFDVRLKAYLPFLNKELLSSADTLNASCLPFRKLVGFLGANYSFNGSDFTQVEAYDTIKTYLNSDSTPKCYNSNDTRLNSTAWFVNYIGVFVNYVSSDDLATFGSENTLKLFTVNPLNIELFSKSNVSEDTKASYTQLIYLQNPNFSPLSLPTVFQCVVPGTAYSTLNQNDSITILGNLNSTCTNVDQDISSALAGNIQTVNAETISALGQESVGLSTAQITSAPPSVIVNALPTFSTVSGWSQGQLINIVNIVLQTIKINTPSNLVSLGTLVGGVPSTTFVTVPPTVVLQSSKNPTFITNLQSAPPIVQQTFVKQIIKVDSTPTQLLVNIPDAMATQIPRNLVLFTNASNAVFINKKTWKPQQAALFFDTVANGFDDPDELSESVLQGFTCTRVRTLQRNKVRRIVRACRRRRNRRKVILRQTQLTCMYNYIKDQKPTDFANYSSDLLLYFNYNNIPQANCKTYFTEAGNADFTVLTRALRGRRATLLNNAKRCLSITGTKLDRDNVEVLGNMACTLDQSYIQDSDPEILEKLKNCNDFTDVQASAMQTVLINGNTKYGPPARWREKTLNDLGILPLYFTNNFWGRFGKRSKRNFLKRFLKRLRGQKTQKRKLKKLFRELLKGTRSKRADECTAGNITRVTISDDAFPFGYDEIQFKLCLSADVAKENIASLAEKVDVDEFQRVILDRLNEAYPSGLSDQQVQLLGSISRVATTADMGKWNISTSDTLAALMNSDDGEWEAEKSKFIVTKFLSGVNNSLGSSELNLMGGPNLCSLDTITLSNINSDSIKEADALDISNCTIDKKRALFVIAKRAFPINFLNRNSDDVTNYQLTEPFLGGADIDFIRGLSSSNVSMDIETFVDLDESVILDLKVSEVSGLLGTNLPDLESYQNETVIQTWISRQLQSDLDTLNLGLTGGRADTTTVSVPAVSNATEAATTAATTASTATTTTTTSAGNKGSSYSLPFIFLMLNLAFFKIQVV